MIKLNIYFYEVEAYWYPKEIVYEYLKTIYEIYHVSLQFPRICVCYGFM